MDIIEVVAEQLYLEYMRERTGCKNPLPAWSESDEVRKLYWRHQAKQEITEWVDNNDCDYTIKLDIQGKML